MRDLAGPALVVDGGSRTMVPEGVRKINGRTATLLPGGVHRLSGLDFELTSETDGDEVTIRLAARGTGRHRFTVRADNLEVGKPSKELKLPGRHSWKARVRDGQAPWVAVVIADDDVEERREIFGSAGR